jgi:hypothetical protein
MVHNELPQSSAKRVLAMINRADDLLTQSINQLPFEFHDGEKTTEDVEKTLCHRSKVWAMDVFGMILREWAEIGIPPADFEAIAKEQIESLSIHAEERVAGFVGICGISNGLVFRCIRDFLPGLIPPYREENRFRFRSMTAGAEALSLSKQAPPQIDGLLTPAELAARRQGVVMPILKQKRWTRGRWATEAGVGKNCIYEYLDGTRNPSSGNRTAMAEALGLTEDQLPQ